MNKRIEYIDTAKGIAILLMIIGHCYWINSIPHLMNIIYSFHMPVFFIISGFLLKPYYQNNRNELFLSIRKLLIPYFITAIIICIICIIEEKNDSMPLNSIIYINLKRIIFANGFNQGNELFATTPSIGPLWFLWAFFVAKTSFNFLKTKFTGFELLSIITSLFIFASLSIQVIRLPFSIQSGICCISYIYIGSIVRNRLLLQRLESFHSLVLFTLIILCIICPIRLGWISISICYFGYMPLIQYPISIISSLLFLVLCKKMPAKLRTLQTIGKNSLYLLCGHALGIFLFKPTFIPIISKFQPINNFIIEITIQFSIAVTCGFLLKLSLEPLLNNKRMSNQIF